MTAPAPGRSNGLAALTVAVACVAAYGNTFDVPFVLDDHANIVDEPAVHAVGLAPEQLARAARGFPFADRWLARASFAANHAIHGLNPAGYHAVNLAFHVGASLLLLLVARRILAAVGFGDGRERDRAAAIAALLFAVHPVHTQAVTYVVQRMTSMGAFFSLLALVLWLGARERIGRARWARVAAAVVAWWLALSCKENYVLVPAIALLVEWLGGDLGARLRARWRLVVAAGGIAIALFVALALEYWPRVVHLNADMGIPVAHRLLSQPRVLVHYLSLLAVPLPGRLHIDYAFRPSAGLLDPPSTAAALALVVVLAIAAVWLRRRAPLVTLAIGWFLLALAVEQSVFPIDLVFEHRLYFASIGIFVAVGAALVRWVRVPRADAWAAAVPLAAVLAVGTVARNQVWRDPAILLADVKTGEGAARGVLTLAATLKARGELDEAERLLLDHVGRHPRDPGACVNLGMIALERGRGSDAEGWFRKALAVAPWLADAWYDLGIALELQGRAGEALAAYETALAREPGHAEASVNLSALYFQAGDLPRALGVLDDAVGRDGSAVAALESRAVLRALAGRDAEALADAHLALALAPRLASPRITLAKVHAVAGRRDAARAAVGEALRLDPHAKGAAAVLEQLR
jgi:tetratricopeptide (TPR) repeat protein